MNVDLHSGKITIKQVTPSNSAPGGLVARCPFWLVSAAPTD